MLQWNTKLTAILALTALVVLASQLANFTWHALQLHLVDTIVADERPGATSREASRSRRARLARRRRRVHRGDVLLRA